MSGLLTILLATFLCGLQVEARLIPAMTSFTKQQTYAEKRIILPADKSQFDIYSDSFLYAICALQGYTFKENQCNVTIETPAFVNATYKDVCSVDLVPDDRKLETLSDLKLYPLGDDKALLSWMVLDDFYRAKSAKIRILRLSNCRFTDLTVKTEKLHGLVPYDNNFDVVLSNKAICGVENCRMTYDSDGKRVSGPAHFMPQVKSLGVTSVLPVMPHSPVKGFYVVKPNSNDSTRYQVLHVAADGKATEAPAKNATFVSPYTRVSNAYQIFGICWATDRTNVTCWQFDAKMNNKPSVTFEFKDEPGFGLARWMQIHNLREGGFLLITGQRSRENERRFDNFRIIKVNADGRRERPLEVEGLDFECTKLEDFSINVFENEDEFCFHFVCERASFDQMGIKNTLSFSSKCLNKKHVSMSKYRVLTVN